MTTSPPQDEPFRATRSLVEDLGPIEFENKVAWTYNPVDYAWDGHEQYLRRFGRGKKRALFLGMNPGPWGMAQTGIPFTDPYIARDWMGLQEPEIEPPANERSERPVEGWNSDRKEASGQRLFGFLRNLYGTLEDFFADHFVVNYCPLVMFNQEAQNLTPEDLLVADRTRLFEACDPYVRSLVRYYDPEVLIGIGRFAEARFESIVGEERPIHYLPHPSPASPIATRDGGDYWRRLVRELLVEVDLLED